MSLAVITSRAQLGIEAPRVSVEVYLGPGLPKLSMVGLPETAVKESKDRVRAALNNSRFQFPARRITISLAPADLPKEGSRFDLAIALGILAASGQLRCDNLADYEFFGELSLSGAIRPVTGMLPAVLNASQAGKTPVIPADNADEASLITNGEIHTAKHLLEVFNHLHNGEPLRRITTKPTIEEARYPDLNEVCGQARAKRALEIAAAGGHNLLMTGPPGTGKTLLASRLPGILPPMQQTEALETAAVRSIAGYPLNPATWRQRPYQSPHHSCSSAALVGGGSKPKPGEISLAHNGILCLDELPEFNRNVLEVLREPMESGTIMISRANHRAEFPARFQLIATMNPCPCGYLGDPSQNCNCSSEQVQRYRSRISGPLLDRIDLHIQVPRMPIREMNAKQARESSAQVRDRVIAARQHQMQRTDKPNAQLSNKEIERHCRLSKADREFLEQAAEKLRLSARAYHRTLKVARTIADSQNSDEIKRLHITEALSYRSNN